MGPGLCSQEPTRPAGARAPSLLPASAFQARAPSPRRSSRLVPKIGATAVPPLSPSLQARGNLLQRPGLTSLTLNRPTRPQRRRAVAIFPFSGSPRCTTPGRAASWEGEFRILGCAGHNETLKLPIPECMALAQTPGRGFCWAM